MPGVYLDSAVAGLPKESKGAGRIDGVLPGQTSVPGDAGLPEPGEGDFAATFSRNGSGNGGGTGRGIRKGERRLLRLAEAILAGSTGCSRGGRRWGSGVVLLQGAQWGVQSRLRQGGRRRRITHGNGRTRRQRSIRQGDVSLRHSRVVPATALEPLQRTLFAASASNTIGGVHAVHPLVEKLLNTLHDFFLFPLYLRSNHFHFFFFVTITQS